MSPFSNLYLKVLERLQQQVPELRYIDQDLGQLESYEQRPAVTFPCALIDIDGFDFSDAGSNTQIGEGMIIIRIGYAPYSASNSLAPEAVREKALEYYNIEQKAHEALHGWSAPGFSKLLRRKSIIEKRDDSFRVKMIPYAVSFDDESTMPVRVSVPRPNPTIIQ